MRKILSVMLGLVFVVAVALFKRRVVEGWISLALPMAVMFFLVSTILGMLSEYIFLLAQHSGNRPVYAIFRESTSSVLEIQRRLNVVEGGGDGAFADEGLGDGASVVELAAFEDAEVGAGGGAGAVIFAEGRGWAEGGAEGVSEGAAEGGAGERGYADVAGGGEIEGDVGVADAGEEGGVRCGGGHSVC